MTDSCIKAIAAHCPGLKKLVANVDDVSSSVLADLVRACPCLQELIVDQFHGSPEDIYPLLEPHLQSLAVMNYLDRLSGEESFEEFVRVIQDEDDEWPALNELRIGWFMLNRSSATIKLHTDALELSAVCCLARHCPPIVKLELEVNMSSAPCTAQALQLVGERMITKKLKELFINVHHTTNPFLYGFRPFHALFPHSGSLTKITLINAQFTDMDLVRVANQCSELVYLDIVSNIPREQDAGITDQGMVVLFTKCSQLEELRLGSMPNITVRTLGVILANKHRLKKFVSRKVSISVQDMARFRLEAKQLELFPVCRFLKCM